MTEPYLDQDGLVLYDGDATSVLAGLPDESVDMCVTSPPFFNLRDYGTGRWEGGERDCSHRPAWKPRSDRNAGGLKSTSGSKLMGAEARGHRDGIYRQECRRCGARRIDEQVGLEASPEEYVERLVEIFREVRRVLRPAGVFLLELGDSHNSYNGNRGASASISANADPGRNEPQRGLTTATLKPKDLLGMPWSLAFALREDGWWLRQEIVWDKVAPMPESCEDRCTTAHSRIFHFAKRDRYFWDGDAIREPAVATSHGTWGERYHGARTGSGTFRRDYAPPDDRNARSIWRIPTEPSGMGICPKCRAFWPRRAPSSHCGVEVVSHFAAFPVALAERALLAGTSVRGHCAACGSPWERIIEKQTLERHELDPSDPRYRPRSYDSEKRDTARRGNDGMRYTVRKTLGWEPTCSCGTEETVSGIVLDPFAGSGTSLLAARRAGRRAIGVELNSDYCEMAVRRLAIPEAIARAAETAQEPTQLAIDAA